MREGKFSLEMFDCSNSCQQTGRCFAHLNNLVPRVYPGNEVDRLNRVGHFAKDFIRQNTPSNAQNSLLKTYEIPRMSPTQ